MKMRKFLAIAVITSITLGMCACGAENTDMDAAGGSGAADVRETPEKEDVSGETSAPPGKDVPEETDLQQGGIVYPFVTKNCMYAKDARGDYIVQYDLQGNELSRHKMKGMHHSLGWVNDHRLCFYEKEGIYSVPIEQTDTGEEVLWNEKEKVASLDVDDDYPDIYVSEPYLVYCTDNAYRYDFETKETKPLEAKKEFKYAHLESDYYSQVFPFFYDGMLYLANYTGGNKGRDKGLYRIDIENWEAEKILSFKDYKDRGYEYECLLQVRGNDILCLDMDGNRYQVTCFDTVGQEKKKVLTDTEVQALLEKEDIWEKGSKKREVEFSGAFQYEDRLYMSFYLSWTKEGVAKSGPEKERKVKMAVDGKEILLSCPWENIEEISYEKELAEWLDNHAQVYQTYNSKLAWEAGNSGYVEWHSGQFHTLTGDELYMTYYDKTKGKRRKAHVAAYNMKTKVYREITKKEMEYHLISYHY